MRTGLVVRLAALVLAALPGQTARGQEKLDFTQPYLLLCEADWGLFAGLTCNDTQGLQEELNQAASPGYRVIASDVDGLMLLLAKGPVEERREYVRVNVADTLRNGKEKGFRFLPATLSVGGRAWMERLADPTQQAEYKLLHGRKIAGIQGEISKAAEQGYELIAIRVADDEHTALMERRPGATAGPPDRYLLLDTGWRQKESVEQASARGYRVVTTYVKNISYHDDPPLLVVLERTSSTMPPKYRRLKEAPREKKLNRAAAEGFRLMPRTLSAYTCRYCDFDHKQPIGTEYEAIMEKDPSATRLNYKVLSATRIKTLRRKLTEAASQGFVPVGVMHGATSPRFIIMVREAD